MLYFICILYISFLLNLTFPFWQFASLTQSAFAFCRLPVCQSVLSVLSVYHLSSTGLHSSSLSGLDCSFCGYVWFYFAAATFAFNFPLLQYECVPQIQANFKVCVRKLWCFWMSQVDWHFPTIANHHLWKCNLISPVSYIVMIGWEQNAMASGQVNIHVNAKYFHMKRGDSCTKANN